MQSAADVVGLLPELHKAEAAPTVGVGAAGFGFGRGPAPTPTAPTPADGGAGPTRLPDGPDGSQRYTLQGEGRCKVGVEVMLPTPSSEINNAGNGGGNANGASAKDANEVHIVLYVATALLEADLCRGVY
jgi:hypothetical protein